MHIGRIINVTFLYKYLCSGETREKRVTCMLKNVKRNTRDRTPSSNDFDFLPLHALVLD